MGDGTLDKVRRMGPCEEGYEYLRGCASLRQAWDGCENRGWMTWIVGKAHRHGTMDQKRLVAIALRWVEPIAHLLPDDSVIDLGVVAAWTIGVSSDGELREARERLWTDADAYAAAAYAAYAANAAAAAAYAAAAAAYAADAYAADDAYAAAAAACDVIRASVTIDEVAAALGIDPDEPIARAAA